jgi:transcriptional regulator GlxA family with amidase domain
MSPGRIVGILVFPDVEVLDFAGPFEVFSVAGAQAPDPLFHVRLVAERDGAVTTRYGLSVNPHHALEEVAPRARVERDRRVVDNGKVVLSAGVSAGIDMALHVVRRLHGDEVADATARHMEYDRAAW